MMRTTMSMIRPLAVLTTAATVVAVTAGCTSKGPADATDGSGGDSVTASHQPNAAEQTLAAALPAVMPGYGSLLYQEAVSGSGYHVNGDAACQRFVNAITIDHGTYNPVGEVVAEYQQDQTPDRAHGSAGITLARLASARDAALLVSDTRSSAAGCKSGFSHNNEKVSLTGEDPPAETPGDSATALVETTSGAASSGARVCVLVVQKDSAVVQIAVNGTGPDADEMAVAKAMATTLVAH